MKEILIILFSLFVIMFNIWFGHNVYKEFDTEPFSERVIYIMGIIVVLAVDALAIKIVEAVL